MTGLKINIGNAMNGKGNQVLPAVRSLLGGGRDKVSIGLDLGGYSLKIAEITKKNETSSLTNFAVEALPRTTNGESISGFIQQVMAEKGFSSRRVNISVSGPQVVVRYVFLPLMTPAELKGAIRFEAEKHIPFNIEQVVLDYQILERETPEKKMKVLLVAAKKELINKRLQLLKDAGLEVEAVDVDAFALINSFLLSETALPAEMPVAILDIGDSSTRINILKNGIPLFTREVVVGGNDITKLLTRRIGVEPEKAEALKHGVSGERSKELNNVVDEVLSNLAKEIKVSFGYFENESYKKVEKIFIAGGTAKTSGLVSSLEAILDVKIETWDVLKTLAVETAIDRESLNQNKDLLPVAIGLARREEKDAG